MGAGDLLVEGASGLLVAGYSLGGASIAVGWPSGSPEDAVGGSYFWACLDDVEAPPETIGYGPALWHGSLFAHAEIWSATSGYDRDEAQAYDLFIPFGDVQCAYGEDAGEYFDDVDEMWVPGKDCDGIDNDLDGVVDEGALDDDANGVADCLE